MSLPRVLITGVDGLIGKYTVRLLSSFFPVLAVSRRMQVAVATGNEVSHAHTDLLDSEEVGKLRDFRADVIVHLAASIPSSFEDEQVAMTNQSIDANIFNLAKESGASVIFCSSVSVYENRQGPWSESMTLAPCSIYARSKLDSEKLFSTLESGALSIRIASPYGVVEPIRKGVLFHFLREAVAGRALTLHGEGLRTQDFIHARDIANAILKIVRFWNKDTGLAKRGVLNIASGAPVSMIELAQLVLKVTNSSSPLHFVGGEEGGDDYRSAISIEQSAHLIDWKPEITLLDGVTHLLKSFEGKNEDWFIVGRAR
ncbi:UDP-glucose 4-epimerase [Janthinobacterium sp. Marseille]|nr:NAD(P)-dependent oxidoreductase [Janthinobacterium sp. Marseille]ABR91667.1 UDP-glucose 4-epimerase [Janthinobacterium sp. Marseille]